MNYQAVITSILEEKIGLSAEAIGHDTIAKSVLHRVNRCGLTGKDHDQILSAYLARILKSEEECEQLVEEVVVPETWFFRNKASFDFMGGHVRFNWLPENKDRILRALSIPCSTGEEPYSMAMTLMEMGKSENISSDRFHIDAVDISSRALHKARLGIYGSGSLRGDGPGFQKDYFETVSRNGKTYFKISSRARNMVRFIKGNILDDRILAYEKPYHIIFCRNLLIYLTDPAKRQAMKVITRLLDPDGILFVGHVERPLVCSSARDIRFVWIRQSGVFACRIAGSAYKQDSGMLSGTKQGVVPESGTESPIYYRADSGQTQIGVWTKDNSLSGSRVSKRLSSLPINRVLPPRLSRESVSGAEKKQSVFEQSVVPKSSRFQGERLHTAQQLADKGYLKQALELCEKQLNEDPFHVQTHFLMGLIWNAMGNEDRAEEYFNKTVYLDPDHYEALNLMAFITEQRGEQDKAEILRQRAWRILQNDV